jgi:hypothetical protein
MYRVENDTSKNSLLPQERVYLVVTSNGRGIYRQTHRLSFDKQGLLKKRRLQEFFVAAGTFLPSSHLVTVEGYTERPTGSPLINTGRIGNGASNNSSLPRERLYRVVT